MTGIVGCINKLLPKYKSQDDSVLQSIFYIQWLLQSIGILTPMAKKTKRIRLFNIFRRIVCCVLHLWVIISIIVSMCDPTNDFNVKIILFAPFAFAMSSLLKYCGLIYRRNLISQCLELIKNEWKITASDEFRQILRKNLKTGQVLVYAFSSVMVITGIFHNYIMPFTKMKIKKSRYNISERLEIFSGYDCFEHAQKSPYYQLMFVSTMSALYFAFTTYICSSSLGIIPGHYIYSQIEIIVFQLNDIVNKPLETEESIKRKIADVTRRHVNVIIFSKHMEEILKEICLVEFIGVIFCVCAAEHLCVIMWERREFVNLTNYTIVIIGLSSSFLIFCWISEIIDEQMFRVSLMSYDIDWHELPYAASKSLILTIAIAQKPMRLTAGGIVNLSSVTFVNFLKTSYVYFKILQS